MDQPVVVFFDGVCGLCNGVVDFILRFDSKEKILFSPLQSVFAQSKLPQEFTQDLSSLVVLKGTQILTRSEAVLAICEQLGGLFRFFLIFRILPRFILNFAYDGVAKYRYQIFGQSQVCRFPNESEKNRFL